MSHDTQWFNVYYLTLNNESWYTMVHISHGKIMSHDTRWFNVYYLTLNNESWYTMVRIKMYHGSLFFRLIAQCRHVQCSTYTMTIRLVGFRV